VNVIDNFELDLYWTKTPLEPKYFFKVRCFELLEDHRYPNNCRLTCDILFISITMVVSEFAFNIGGHVFKDITLI